MLSWKKKKVKPTRAMRTRETIKIHYCYLPHTFKILATKVLLSEDSGFSLSNIFNIQVKANNFSFIYKANYALMYI